MSDDEPEKIAAPIPPEVVKLTEPERMAITDHINRKAIVPDDACPVCGDPSNFVAVEVYRLEVLHVGTVLGGEHQPLVSTICNNCGFVRLFNRLIVDRALRAEQNAGEAAAADDDGG